MDAPPEWVAEEVARTPAPATDADLMDLAVRIALANAERAHGPFGAVVADADGRVVEIGWNHVRASNDSTAHAEVTALRRAQAKLGTHDLSTVPGLALYSSAAPCIQCFGAIYWSGLRKVFASARRDDVEALGFREGPVSPELWRRAAEERGVAYVPSFQRSAASLRPFAVYREKGGPLY